MKVNQLIHLLEQCDPDAEVMLGIQPSYPFEHRIRGLVQRSDFQEVDPEDRGDGPDQADAWADSFTTKGRPNDVFLCEGGQVRYGDRDMFEACGWQ